MGPELGIHPRVSFELVVLLMCTHFFTSLSLSLSLSPSYTHTHTHLSLRGLQTAAREKIGQKRWSQRPKEPFCHFVSLSSIWYCSFVRASQIKAVYNSDLKIFKTERVFLVEFGNIYHQRKRRLTGETETNIHNIKQYKNCLLILSKKYQTDLTIWKFGQWSTYVHEWLADERPSLLNWFYPMPGQRKEERETRRCPTDQWLISKIYLFSRSGALK
jgi:hypothetical protein